MGMLHHQPKIVRASARDVYSFVKIRRTSRQKDTAEKSPQVQSTLSDAQPQQFSAPLITGRQLRLISAEKSSPSQARVVFEFSNPPTWSNSAGTLHGGAQATIHDIVTSFAITPLTRADFWITPGVSRVLGCTYIRPAPPGEVLLVEGEVGGSVFSSFVSIHAFCPGVLLRTHMARDELSMLTFSGGVDCAHR